MFVINVDIFNGIENLVVRVAGLSTLLERLLKKTGRNSICTIVLRNTQLKIGQINFF